MEPTPISTLSPPWIVVIILMTISGAEAPKAKNEAPATSSLRFNFTQRISKLGTRNSSQSYPLLENTKYYITNHSEWYKENEDFNNNTPPILINCIKTKTFKTRFTPLY